MLWQITRKILGELIEKTDITHAEFVIANDPVYIEIDEKTLEVKEDQEFPKEFDIIIHGDV